MHQIDSPSWPCGLRLAIRHASFSLVVEEVRGQSLVRAPLEVEQGAAVESEGLETLDSFGHVRECGRYGSSYHVSTIEYSDEPDAAEISVYLGG